MYLSFMSRAPSPSSWPAADVIRGSVQSPKSGANRGTPRSISSFDILVGSSPEVGLPKQTLDLRSGSSARASLSEASTCGRAKMSSSAVKTDRNRTKPVCWKPSICSSVSVIGAAGLEEEVEGVEDSFIYGNK